MNVFHLTDSKSHIIYSNLPKACVECLSKVFADGHAVKNDNCKSGGKGLRKQVALVNEYGKIYYCTDDRDEINSPRLFKEKVKLFSSFLRDISAIRNNIANELNKDTKRLLHNVTSINAHNIQEIYALVPQEIVAKNPKNQIEVIKSFIATDLDESAKTFLRIAKNNASLKTEFAVFKKIFEPSPNLQFKPHPIRKVVLNLFHIFFQDFSDNGVYVNIGETKRLIILDYESIHVALFHLIENATKYVLPNSTLRVGFVETEKTFVVRFEMMSMQIKDSEKEKIFLEGFCGETARKSQKAGDGIGMSFIKKILSLNNASLEVKTNNGKRKYFNGINYEKNIFDLIFYFS